MVGSAKDAMEVFNKFVESINRHQADMLGSLMTPDHLFVDSVGNEVRGVNAMRGGWEGYFALCPDYSITVRNTLSDATMVLATGEAGGTIDSTKFQTPAAWHAVIRNGRVAEWRVFADNKPVYDILARRSADRS